jgi:arsenical pump membrane protein
VPPLVVDVVCVAALASLLAVAYRHPPAWLEALSGVVTVAVLAAVGALSWSVASDELDGLLPVVAFLVASLVVAEVCAAEGVFAYLGSLVTQAGRGRPVRTLVVTTVVAALVTALLSLDATVVLLTPVVVAAAAGGASSRPLAATCVRLANSASLLLPVSNLTNLLALPAVDLGFLRWAAVMAVPWLAVLAVEYAGVRLVHARDLRPGGLPRAGDLLERPAPPVFSLVVVALMLAGFAAASPLGVQVALVAGIAAVVLAVHSLAGGRIAAPRLVRSLHLPFALFVLALGLVVAAASGTFLGDVVDEVLAAMLGDRVPGAGAGGLLGLAVVALVATVLANLVNNLPATLLLVPLVAPLGTPAVLAMLVGVGVGAGLTYPGSLANLLWRRVMVRLGDPPSTATFQRHAVLVTPVAVGVAVVLLWCECALGLVP